MKKIRPRIYHIIYQLITSYDSGVALVEFSIALPLVLIMFFGMVEGTNYIIYNQKVDKIAYSMANFVTQGTTVGKTELANFASVATNEIMQPYTFNGTIIFSSVATYSAKTLPCTVKKNCLNWQYTAPGGLGDVSNIGTAVDGTAVVPGGYNVVAGQNIIVAEVFEHYTPLLSVSSNFISAFKAQTIYKEAVLVPRSGTLTTLGP